MRKMFLSLLTIAAALLMAGVFAANLTTAYADDILEPYQYEIEFDNGTKFCMYTGNSSSLSGLYYSAEPFENIYLLETPTYFYKGELFFSADGLYFAHLPWTLYNWDTKQGGAAVAFYSSGSKTKQYSLSEIVFDMSVLEPSVSHVEWENTAKRIFYAEINYLQVTALDNTTTGFDIATGEINFRDPGTGFPCSFCGDPYRGHIRLFGELFYKDTFIAVVVVLSIVVVLGGFAIYKTKKKKRNA